MRLNVSGRKTRLIYAGAGALTLALPATAAGLTAASLSSDPATAHLARSTARAAVINLTRAAFTEPTIPSAAQRGCGKLFTVAMAQRAANRIYAGDGAVHQHALEVLGYIERCQRNPAAQGFVRDHDHRVAQLHSARVAAARAASSSSGGGWAIPAYVVQCESGGQNLPPNSAGASGYYQIIASTWQGYGGGRYAPQAYQATAQQQGMIASRIWDGGAGAQQWVCAGG